MPEKLMDKLIRFAEKKDNIPLMALSGSSVGPKVRPDRFMDFGVLYGVKDPKPFLQDPCSKPVSGRTA